MNKYNFLLSVCLLTSLAASPTLMAQEATQAPDKKDTPQAPEKKDDKPFNLAANLAFTSNYISRGQTQSFGNPAVQGGFDVDLSPTIPDFIFGI